MNDSHHQLGLLWLFGAGRQEPLARPPRAVAAWRPPVALWLALTPRPRPGERAGTQSR